MGSALRFSNYRINIPNFLILAGTHRRTLILRTSIEINIIMDKKVSLIIFLVKKTKTFK
jgi:hypothetical protein